MLLFVQKNNVTICIDAKQVNRVYSAKITALKAQDENLSLVRCAMTFDAFSIFRDSIDVAAEAGVICIMQPRGLIRDNEVIAAENTHNIAMIFGNIRHFRH